MHHPWSRRATNIHEVWFTEYVGVSPIAVYFPTLINVFPLVMLLILRLIKGHVELVYPRICLSGGGVSLPRLSSY
jgi:hypothetical protein